MTYKNKLSLILNVSLNAYWRFSMFKAYQRVFLITLALVFVFSIVGCSSTPATEVILTKSQVKQILKEMLNAYNKADYETFSQKLTPALKLVVTKEAFQKFCSANSQTIGQFKAIEDVTQTESGKTSTTWSVTANFEHIHETFNVTFDKSTGLIEGIDFGPKG